MKHIIAHGNHRWSLEGTQMEVEVILASQGPAPCKPIYTLRMRYPRIIHSEVMTHRVFSRNARSSRAVPVKTMLDEVRKTPFVPWHWGKNQGGMQAGEEHSASVKDWWLGGTLDNVNAWWQAATGAVAAAEAFSKAGYHKQICNRLLEPFAWIDTLVTSTEWENFLWLRDHKDAEPHLQDLARLVKQAIDSAEVQTLEPGQWHLPYIDFEDRYFADQTEANREEEFELLCKISAARCARISYAPFDGDASYERELERYDSLVKSDRVHASPLEHQATPDKLIDEAYHYRPTGVVIDNKVGFERKLHKNWACAHLAGNLGPGWVQYRKTVPNENHTS